MRYYTMSLTVYGKLFIGTNAEPISLTTENDTFEISSGNETLMTLSPSNDFAGLQMEFESLSQEDKQVLSFTATVNYIDLEGGFIGLITEANEKYIPVNKQSELEPLVDQSINVTSAYAKKNAASIYMWGKLVYVESFSA